MPAGRLSARLAGARGGQRPGAAARVTLTNPKPKEKSRTRFLDVPTTLRGMPAGALPVWLALDDISDPVRLCVWPSSTQNRKKATVCLAGA